MLFQPRFGLKVCISIVPLTSSTVGDNSIHQDYMSDCICTLSVSYLFLIFRLVRSVSRKKIPNSKITPKELFATALRLVVDC